MSTDNALVPVTAGFSGPDAAHIAGITYRQLDHWDTTQLVSPSLVPAAGSGSRRSYSYNDVLALSVASALRSAGIQLPQIRAIFDSARGDISSGDPIQLVIVGTEVAVSTSGAEVIALLEQGQGAVTVVSLERIRNEMAEKLAAMYPSDYEERVLVEAS